MKFLCTVKGCPGLDRNRNERVGEESGVKLILTQIMRYGEKGGEHLKAKNAVKNEPEQIMGPKLEEVMSMIMMSLLLVSQTI
jgi:hypothetical protein